MSKQQQEEEEATSTDYSAWYDVLYSLASATLSKTLRAPGDRIRMHQQTNLSNTWQSARQIIQYNGIVALFLQGPLLQVPRYMLAHTATTTSKEFLHQAFPQVNYRRQYLKYFFWDLCKNVIAGAV